LTASAHQALTLRDYQERDLQALRLGFRQHRSGLLVQPTGAGKGTLASHIVQSAVARGNSVLFLVNRRTLVHDMSKRLDRIGIDHGIIMGSHPRRKAWLRTHVASIDTLHRRDVVPAAAVLIVDEAHFAVSPTFLSVLGKYPEAKVLCMTATPIRVDGRGLGEICEFMVKGPTVRELIDLGYLVPSRVFAPSSPDVSAVKKTAGDFNQKQLAAVCDRAKLVGDIVAHWKQHASDRKTAVFGVDQNHAKHLAEQFQEAGANFAYVDAETPDEERDRIWDGLDSGSVQGVTSVGVISYGWDHPIVSCVILARPTTSLSLHLQQIGRGSRPHPGKRDLLVLDHASNTHRHGFYEDDRGWSLDGGLIPKKGAESAMAITGCRKCFGVFKRGPVRCPYCGAPITKQSRNVIVDDGALEEIQRERKLLAIEEWREKVTGDKRREKFEEFCRIAEERGYKKTWPAMKFKAIFGQWPSSEWRRERAN
jgi:DNA repair protein RadD